MDQEPSPTFNLESLKNLKSADKIGKAVLKLSRDFNGKIFIKLAQEKNLKSMILFNPFRAQHY